MIIYEPFTASFTGSLTSICLASGKSISFKHPYVRVEKGQPFMLKITEQGSVTMLPVLVPEYWRS